MEKKYIKPEQTFRRKRKSKGCVVTTLMDKIPWEARQLRFGRTQLPRSELHQSSHQLATTLEGLRVRLLVLIIDWSKDSIHSIVGTSVQKILRWMGFPIAFFFTVFPRWFYGVDHRGEFLARFALLKKTFRICNTVVQENIRRCGDFSKILLAAIQCEAAIDVSFSQCLQI